LTSPKFLACPVGAAASINTGGIIRAFGDHRGNRDHRRGILVLIGLFLLFIAVTVVIVAFSIHPVLGVIALLGVLGIGAALAAGDADVTMM
jgi:hypothetical protein